MVELLLVFLLLTAAAGALIVQAYLTERATERVVGIFRDHRAESIWTARAPHELGLGPRSLMQRLVDPRRDYKAVALHILMDIGIVRKTGHEKLYLSEKDLAGVCRKTENRPKICSLSGTR